MLEILFLLLPLAASYGWYMGRRSMRHQQQNKQRKLSKEYFSGLNFILSNESDKAVDFFIDMLDVDDETIETHLSLGALFRKRGEVDRAIRIHQNLISRPSLASEQLEMAMSELGKDYMAAGFYDRAEEIFLSLLQQSDDTQEAEAQLISIYQTIKDWRKAIKVINSMNRSSRNEYLERQAHYYCQLSDETDDPAKKIKYLKLAIKQDAKCTRALLELAKVHASRKEYKQSKNYLLSILSADIDFIADALEVTKEVYFAQSDTNGYRDFLQQAIEKGAGVSVNLEVVHLLLQNQSLSEAEQILLDSLYQNPTMKGFQELMKLYLNQTKDDASKDNLARLEKLVSQQIAYRPSYRCKSCGFPAHVLYWHCPSCKSWGKITRIKGIDGE
ncbi:lipopolysaccharide assembly protein LapB [Parashewanella curva]|uniref:Lipopolysaccharide assembly protein B n=1 Tax=Parashewanella curva TaxID=2338552 RepID=A0A3L8Q3G3_9GAMM|nr:lipopolysaccharide assembly protein LapB [Parashewanella curva]RLV61222.1 lipopolysaccharide assembly protein LapB [Parashewanella curva]